MDFPVGYELGMTDDEIATYWPNLSKNHFEITSLKTNTYNCLAWALGDDSMWMDMYVFQIKYDLNAEDLDHSSEGYAIFLEKYYGFEKSDNGELEERMDKIALFEDNNRDWTHACRQLSDGKWASKMGRWEDIEHVTLEVLEGKFYGKHKIFMKRQKK
jgi:hypothetical protein